MKKALRIYITGSLQSLFFRTFVKSSADASNVRGFIRVLEDGRVEIFLEGNKEDVDSVAEVCRKGPKYAQIRGIEEKEERFQDFKEFKILNF
ncbi:acylphosphatase [Candidatus Pacearchaeota archaeon]|nr:acylphosphatase [Candidatus Pacearchaeota archaeon]QBM01526.1 acylphosphatase [uncultured archaeon]